MKGQSRAFLVRKLDSEISKYIRLSNADENGYVSCVSCRVTKHWKEMQAGHYISRSHYSTRWDTGNIFPQCVGCNIFKNGNYPEYAQYLDDKFGTHYKKDLLIRGAKTIQITNAWLMGEIAQYKELNLQFRHLK